MTKEELLQVAKEVVEAGSNGAYRNFDYLLLKAAKTALETDNAGAYRDLEDKIMVARIEELQEKVNEISDLLFAVGDRDCSDHLWERITALKHWKDEGGTR